MSSTGAGQPAFCSFQVPQNKTWTSPKCLFIFHCTRTVLFQDTIKWSMEHQCCGFVCFKMNILWLELCTWEKLGGFQTEMISDYYNKPIKKCLFIHHEYINGDFFYILLHIYNIKTAQINQTAYNLNLNLYISSFHHTSLYIELASKVVLYTVITSLLWLSNKNTPLC